MMIYALNVNEENW